MRFSVDLPANAGGPLPVAGGYNTTPVLIETFVQTPRYTGDDLAVELAGGRYGERQANWCQCSR